MPVRSQSKGDGPTVLVTGATGFIGQRIVQSFLDRGWQVIAAVHNTPLSAAMTDAGVKAVQCSTGDLQPLADALDEAQAVCHSAAFLPPDYADSQYAERCLEVNAIFTLRLAELAAARPGLRFVHLSSAQAYAAAQPQPCAENTPLYPAGRAAYYLTSKLAGELFVEHQRQAHGLAAIGLRVGSCYGPGMTERSVVSIFLERARTGQPIEVHDGGRATCDYVYVDDVARIAVRAAESGDPGLYNLGSGRASTILELAHAAADAYPETHVPITVRPASAEPALGFPALCMQKTNTTWNHQPTDLRTGLAAMRQCSESQQERRRVA